MPSDHDPVLTFEAGSAAEGAAGLRPEPEGRASPSEPHRLVIFHPMDPRGMKLGGVETHVRLVLERHPADFRVLLVGVDEVGDLPIGRVGSLERCGRRLDFLPVARIGSDQINLAARRLSRSTTLRFALGALRRLPAIRRAAGRGPASAEIERFEFAPIARLAGLRTIMLIHTEFRRGQSMDSLLKRFWYVQALSEKVALTLADRIFCVNESIKRRLRRIRPRAADKCEVMTVSVDRRRFAPRPFDFEDGVFRVLYSGRLDLQKNPPLMFRTIAAAQAAIGPRFEFHLVGPGDPSAFPEYALIEDFTIRHGARTSDEVATIAGRCHVGLLTSSFEGLPCFILETLSVGRPFVARRLPQYAGLIVPGKSGASVDPALCESGCEREMANALVDIWDQIRLGRFDPEEIGGLVEPFSADRQMTRLFASHRALASGFRGRRPRSRQEFNRTA